MNAIAETKLKISLPPAAVAVFVFCFAVCVGAIWEIFEFSMDAMLGLNMQKTMIQNGEALIGQASVFDTMKDIIVDTCGSIIASVAVYFSLKRQRRLVSESDNRAENLALAVKVSEEVRVA